MTRGDSSGRGDPADNRWRSPLTQAAARDHIAQLYQDEAFLTEAVCHFVGEGLRKGDGVIVIATLQRWRTISRLLEGEGCSPAEPAREGHLLYLEGGGTLARLMIAGMPDRLAFENVIGGAVGRMRRHFTTVRVFSEMVDLLWQSGNRPAALRLEAFWADLVKANDISLFCVYAMNPLDAASYGGPLESICQAHSHLIPSRNYDRLDSAVQEASSTILHPPLASMLKTVAHIDRPATDMPFGQLVLLWLKKNMPITANRVLEQVRHRFETPVARPR
jgi:hypothetical protein